MAGEGGGGKQLPYILLIKSKRSSHNLQSDHRGNSLQICKMGMITLINPVRNANENVTRKK